MRYLFLIFVFSCFFNSYHLYGQCDGTEVQPMFTMVETSDDGIEKCFDITVQNFENVNSFQFALSLAPSTFTYSSFTDYLALSDFIVTNAGSAASIAGGIFSFNFATGLGTPDTVLDDTAIFGLCFTVIGDPGDCSDFVVTSNGNTSYEVSVDNGSPSDCQFTLEDLGGPTSILETCVDCSDLSTNIDICHSSGDATFFLCGGVPPYNWSINTIPAQTGTATSDGAIQNVSGLVPGNFYRLDYIDSGGVSRFKEFEVFNVSPLTIVVDQEKLPSCSEYANGVIEVHGENGGTDQLLQSSYTYEWSNGHRTNEIDRLPVGTYTVTVTDAAGCTAEQTFTLDVPPIVIDATVKQANCNQDNGEITIIVTGGQPYPGDEYRIKCFLASFPETVTNNVTFSNLQAGQTYLIEVWDNSSVANGCKEEVEITITDGGSSLSTTTTVSNESCAGDCDGSFLLDFNEVGNFVFGNVINTATSQVVSSVIPNASMGTLEATGLCPGSYEIMAINTDNNCPFDTTIVVEGYDQLVLNVANVEPSTNCDNPNGSIFLMPDGGNDANYTYTWNPNVANTNTVFEDLAPGLYEITVTDANTCTDSVSVYVTGENFAEVEINVLNPIGCNGSTNGRLDAVPVNAASVDFNYEWYDITDNSLIGTTQQIDVDEGRYYVVISNIISGCEASDTIDIFAVNDLTFDSVPTNPSCFDTSDGVIMLTNITGGQAPYEVKWVEYPDASGFTLPNVPAGTYNVVVRDVFNCEQTGQVTLTAPPEILVLESGINAVTCPGGTDGFYEITVSGGTASNGYTIDWAGNDNDQSNVIVSQANNLMGGDYEVTVTDELQCSVVHTFTINQPEDIVIDEATSVIISPSCGSDCVGSVILNFTGGTLLSNAVYDVVWSDGFIGSTRSDICPDLYVLEVTDALGCKQNIELDFTTNSATSLTIEIDPLLSTPNSCNDNNSGQIGVSTTGGDATGSGYTYEWTNDVAGSDEDFASGLSAGLYGITVTDNVGCTASTEYEVSAAVPIVADIPQPDMAACAGGKSCITVENVSGGTGGPYSFQINNQPPLLPIDTCFEVFAGVYSISIFDTDGCSFDTNVTVEEPNLSTIELGPNLEYALGEDPVEIDYDYTGDSAIDTVIWSTVDTFSCVSADCQSIAIEPTQNQNVSATVVDVNGCSVTDELLLTVSATRKVFMPTIFMLGDTENGKMMIFPGKSAVSIKSFKIYDRWGGLVYNLENIAANDASLYGWDGTISGKDAEIGVYVYIADILFKDGESKIFTNDVTLIR